MLVFENHYYFMKFTVNIAVKKPKVKKKSLWNIRHVHYGWQLQKNFPIALFGKWASK